jgi:hypothetical protein
MPQSNRGNCGPLSADDVPLFSHVTFTSGLNGCPPLKQKAPAMMKNLQRRDSVPGRVDSLDERDHFLRDRCVRAMTRRNPHKKGTPEQRRRWSLSSRYGMTPQEYAERLTGQRGLCALCGNEMRRPCVDHNHRTGKVRAIVCHPCNIKLPVVEDMGWVMLAWAYLEEHD